MVGGGLRSIELRGDDGQDVAEERFNLVSVNGIVLVAPDTEVMSVAYLDFLHPTELGPGRNTWEGIN